MDNYGNTPMHWAAENNQVESVKFLLIHGANPNLRNNNMMAPLHIAVQGMHNEMAKVRLLPGAGGASSAGAASWLSAQAQLAGLSYKGKGYIKHSIFVLLCTPPGVAGDGDDDIIFLQ